MGNLAFLEKKAVVVGGGIQPFRAAVAVPFPQQADIMGFASAPGSGVLQGCSLAVPGRARHCCRVEKNTPVKGDFSGEYKLIEQENLLQHVLHLACWQIPERKICKFLPGMLCVDFCSFNFPKQGVSFYISTSAAGRVGSSSGFSLNAKE